MKRFSPYLLSALLTTSPCLYLTAQDDEEPTYSYIYWTGSPFTPGSNIEGGSGIWDNTLTNWTNADGTAALTWGESESPTTVAVFGGISSGGSILMNSITPIYGAGIQIASNHQYFFDGPGILELKAGTTTFFSVEANSSAFLNITIEGDGALRKTGSGTLNLGNSGGYTGGVIVDGGGYTSIITNTALGNPSDGVGMRINDSNAIGSISAGVSVNSAIHVNNGANFYQVGTLNTTNLPAISSTNSAKIYNTRATTSSSLEHAIHLHDGGIVVNSGDSDTFIAARITGGTGKSAIYSEGGELYLGNGNNAVISSDADAISVQFGGMVQNNAGGTISSSSTTGHAAIRADHRNLNIVNSAHAEITSSSVGIYLTAGGEVNNSGSIKSTNQSSNLAIALKVDAHTNPFTLYNYGEIEGNVTLAGSNRTVSLYRGSTIKGDLTSQNSASALRLVTEFLLPEDQLNLSANLSDLITGSIDFQGSLTTSAGTHWILDKDLLNFSSLTIHSGQTTLSDITIDSAVIVQTNAVLSGKANITDTLTVHTWGRSELSDSTISTLDLQFASWVQVQLGSTDLIAATENLIFSDLITFDLVGSNPVEEGSQRLFTYSNQLVSEAISPIFTGAPIGFSLSLDYSTPGVVSLVTSYDGIVVWNGAQTTSDPGVIHGGDGVWDNSTTNWTNHSGNSAGSWEDGMSAVFMAQPGTVTVNQTHQINGLQFQADNYLLTGTGSLNIINEATHINVSQWDQQATIDLSITGAGGLAKVGQGTINLTRANSYSGTTVIAEGTLRQGVAGAIPAGTDLIVNGGTLDLNGYAIHVSSLAGTSGDLFLNLNNDGITIDQTTNTTYSGFTSGSGNLIKDGSGTLHLTGNLQHTGQTVLNNGRLATSDLAHSTLVVNGGTYSFGGDTMSTINLGGLILNGGEFVFQLGLGINDQFVISGSDAELLSATHIVFEAAPDFKGGLIPLINGVKSDWDLSLLTFSGLDGATNRLILSSDGTQLLLSTYNGEPISGPLLQNSAPVGIPDNAWFVVEGEARTGSEQESNTIERLTFKAGSSLQIFNTLTLTGGRINVANGHVLVFGGHLFTPGDLTFTGTGTLNLQSDVTAGGRADITSGALYINGNFIANNGLHLHQNAFLGGSGTLLGDLFNHGHLNPGNSPGVFTIAGDYIQTGLLEIEVLSPKLHDELHVGGIAYLSGTLAVTGNGLKFGKKLTFLHAGSIEGNFDHILTPGHIRTRLTLKDGKGSLLFAPKSYTHLAATLNQHAVAGALDHFIQARSGDRHKISLTLDQMTHASDYQRAFNAIMPTFYESLGQIRSEQSFSHLQSLSQRLSALARQPFRALGVEPTLAYDRDGTPTFTPASDHRWGLWVEGNGLFAKIASVNQLPSYRFDSGGFTAGAEFQWNESFSTGLYGGYQYTKSNSAVGGRTQIDSALFGGYASYETGGFYANALIGGGTDSYDLRRPVKFADIDRTAKSRPDGTLFNTGLNLGYDWQIGQFTLGPIAAIQYAQTHIDSLTETGADSLDLRLGSQNIRSLRTVLGARATTTWTFSENITVSPELRISWQREHLNDSRTLNASLDAGAGREFQYTTASPSRDRLFLGAGFSSRLGDRWDASLFYNATVGEGELLVNMVSGGISWKF